MIPRHQIRLEKWTTVKDGSGNNTESVTAKYNLWGSVSRNGGSRIEQGGRVVLANNMKIEVRFRPDFNPTGNWRVVYNGKRYTVQSIERSNEDRFTWIINTSGD